MEETGEVMWAMVLGCVLGDFANWKDIYPRVRMNLRSANRNMQDSIRHDSHKSNLIDMN
jgi:hypothetical protein